VVLSPFNSRLCLSHPRASPGLISMAMPGTLFYSVPMARYSWVGGTPCIYERWKPDQVTAKLCEEHLLRSRESSGRNTGFGCIDMALNVMSCPLHCMLHCRFSSLYSFLSVAHSYSGDTLRTQQECLILSDARLLSGLLVCELILFLLSAVISGEIAY
jgi:hypothetical protein